MKKPDFKNFDGKKLLSEFTSSRKFKYGSSAIVFTAVFVVFIILINVVISVIDSKAGGLYFDLTSKKLFEISSSSKDALSDIQPVNIIFCRPSDRVDDDVRLSNIKRLAESYGSEFSDVSLIYKDIISDPTYFNQFKTTSADTINDASVIVHCPNTGKSVIYDSSKLYKYTTQGRLFAFDGENKLTSAILDVTNPQTLKAGFTTGHGEDGYQPLMIFLEQQGYEVSIVDLKTTPKDALSQYNLLVICNPSSDFSGLSQSNIGAVNEISLLNSYLTGSFGNLMVFINNETSELTELKQFLSDDWGVSYTSGAIIKESKENDVSGDGYGFLGTYSSDTESSGYKLHSDISKNSTSARAIFDYCTPIEIKFSENGYKTVSSVVTSSANSSIVNSARTKSASYVPVMVLSDYTRNYDSGDKHAYVLTCGSTSFLNCLDYSDYYTTALQYANNDLIKSALKTMGKTNVTLNIDYKVLDETDIAVTESVVNQMTRRLALIVPCIIAIIGTVVFIKRKYL